MKRRTHGGVASLRPLAEALGPFGGFDGARCKQDQIHAALGRLAQRARAGGHEACFYTVREAAAYYGVSLWTVAAVYRSLEREGLLVRIRGSRTAVPVRRRGGGPQSGVRGVVVVMVWLPGFLHVPDVRYAVMLTEERLRRAHFVADLIFYREEDKADPALAARVIAHEPDCVIWFTPKADDTAVIETIADAGIRVVPVADRPVPTRTPQYAIRWRKGLEEAMRTWRADGVRRVAVPVGARRVTSCTHALKAVASETGLEFTEHRLCGDDVGAYIDDLAARPETGVVLDDDLWSGRLCALWPRHVMRLLTTMRVLTPRTLPLDESLAGQTRMEALILPWPAIIDRIVGDLASGRIHGVRRDIEFEAAWHRDIPVRRISRLNDYENPGPDLGAPSRPV